MKTKGLGALILYSPNPERLAKFYRDVIGIPFELQTHGRIREHYECSYHNIHFAILKRNSVEVTCTIVPSFRVDDIAGFVKEKNLEMLHPVIDLGKDSFISTIKDVDGNMIRLWMNRTAP